MDRQVGALFTTVLYVAIGPLMAAAGVYWVRTYRERFAALLGAFLVVIGILVLGTVVVDPVWWSWLVPGPW
jgi:hypothetical protein